jgi:hypothetical protein
MMLSSYALYGTSIGKKGSWNINNAVVEFAETTQQPELEQLVNA